MTCVFRCPQGANLLGKLCVTGEKAWRRFDQMLNQVKADCIKQLAEVQESGQENGTAISGAPGEELEKEQSMSTVRMNTPRGEYLVSGADRDGDGIPDALQVCDLSGWCTNWFITVCLLDVTEREMGRGTQDFR